MLPLAYLGLLPAFLGLGLWTLLLAAMHVAFILGATLLLAPTWLCEWLAKRLEPIALCLVSWRTKLLALCSALLLSACGTAPLQLLTCPPVPAELMRSPSPPVLLNPASASTTPGATSASTPRAAPPIAPGTKP